MDIWVSWPLKCLRFESFLETQHPTQRNYNYYDLKIDIIMNNFVNKVFFFFLRWNLEPLINLWKIKESHQRKLSRKCMVESISSKEIKGKNFSLSELNHDLHHCSVTWDKVHVWNKSIKDLQSFTICPILDRIETSPTKALTTSFESPSKMACLKPSSSIKVIALHAANASRTSIVEGISVFSASEPITWPKSFLTTTPILAFSSSTKCAPS